MLGGSTPPWLHAKCLLSQFGDGHYAAKTSQTAKATDTAKMAFADYVNAGAGLPSIWDELHGQIVLGDREFAGTLSTLLSTSKGKQGETPRELRRAAAQPLAYFRAMPARDFAIALAYQTSCYSMKDIAQALDVHYTTVSRIVKKADAQVNAAGLSADQP